MRLGYRKPKVVCSALNCKRDAVARGLCQMHWKRWRVHGDANYQRPGFWDRVAVKGPEDCWLWIGPTRGRKQFQYGSAHFQGRHQNSHRVCWLLTHGDIPELPGSDSRGTVVRHKCDVSLCCNPAHLEIGTHTDNMRDAKDRKRSSRFKKLCRHGHERTEENLYVAKDGLRQCRVCHKLRQRRYKVHGNKEQRTF